MSAIDTEVQSGLEGVVAFATEIAEPDKEGGALRYRGVDIEDLVGNVPFEQVWGLLVDGTLEPGLPPAEPHPLIVRSGDPRVDVQSALAMLAPSGACGQLIDISDEQARDDLARASVMALSFVAQSARGAGRPPVPQREVDQGALDPRAVPDPLARRGRPGPRQGDRRLLDLRRRARHERLDLHRARHRLDRRRRRGGAVGAVGALSGPLHGGAPSRVLQMLDDVERDGDAERYVKGAARPRRPPDGLRPPRLPRRGPARPRPAPDGARARRRRASRSPRRSRQAALAELQARKPDRVLATNVEFWSAVVLDFADVPAELFTSMFTCARTAGWSAHILEQKREGRLIRPTAEVRRPAPPAREALVQCPRSSAAVAQRAPQDVAQRDLIARRRARRAPAAARPTLGEALAQLLALRR